MGPSRDERDRGNRVMSIALAALIIALASLPWNLSCDRIGALGGGRLADLGFRIFGCADLRTNPGL